MNGSPQLDAELLRQYTRDGSEQAFRELVQRHIQMVNCTARRIVAGDAHLAQDVIQMVFTDLARKARSLPTGVVLGGWLHRHTCYTAANIVRAESRRRVREKHAVDMETLNQTTSNDALWQKLTPVLDEALNHLASRDRDAIVLRYLEQQDLRSIGQVLGTSENTTHMRITRALEKLRIFLERRGVTFSAALLATTLDAGAATTPPLPALVYTVSTHALTGATASASGFTLTTLYNMIISKSKLSVAALVLVGLVVTYLIQNKLHTPAPKAVEAITAPTRKVALSSPLPAQQQPVVVTLTPMTTPQPPPQDASTMQTYVALKLRSITVPNVNFSSVSLDKLIRALALLSAQFDKDGVGINMVALPDADGAFPLVSLSLQGANLEVTLDDVAKIADYSYSIDDDGIIIFRPNAVSMAIQPTSGNKSAAKPAQVTATPESGNSDANNIKNALVKLGVDFPPGSGLMYNPDNNAIAVFNSQNNMELLDNVLKQLPVATTAPANLTPATSLQSPPQDTSNENSFRTFKLPAGAKAYLTSLVDPTTNNNQP